MARGASPAAMCATVNDRDVDDLMRQMRRWSCEPRQPSRKSLPDGMEISEIAQVLGVSDSAVKQCIASAFHKIRRRHPELRHHLGT